MHSLIRHTTFSRKFLLIAYLAVAVITTAVPINSWLTRPTGSTFTGASYESHGDIFVYLDFIDQARDGHWRFYLPNTNVQHEPVLFHPLFLAIGLLAKIVGVQSLTAWHLARVLLIFPLLLVLATFVERIPTTPHRKKLLFVLVLTAGGLLSELYEGSTFLSMLYSPLSVFTLLTTLIYFHTILAFLQHECNRLRILTCIVLPLVQAMVHPYVLVLWGVIPLVLVVWEFCHGRMTTRASFSFYWPVAFGMCIALAYLVVLMASTPVLRTWAEGASIRSWPLRQWVPLLGALLPLALIGMFTNRHLIRTSTPLRFMLIWPLCTLLLSWSSFAYAGRLLLVLNIPLVLFAGLGLFALHDRLVGREAKILIVGILVVLMTLDTMHHLGGNVAQAGRYSLTSNMYVTPSEREGFRWIRTQTPENALLIAAPLWDTLIAQQSKRRVYRSIQDTIPHSFTSFYELLDIYAGHYSPNDLLMLLQTYVPCYIIVSDRDRHSGFFEADRFFNPSFREQYAFSFSPERYPFLKKVYDRQGFAVYAFQKKVR